MVRKVQTRKRHPVRKTLKTGRIRQMKILPEKISVLEKLPGDIYTVGKVDKDIKSVKKYLRQMQGPVMTSWIKWSETNSTVGGWVCPPLNTLLDLEDFLALADDSGVSSIKFGNDFNEEIPENILPENLQSITFGESFNQRIIPGTLSAESIVFGELGYNKENNTVFVSGSFNQPFEKNTFTSSTRAIFLPQTYSQKISPDVFPKGHSVKILYEGNI